MIARKEKESLDFYALVAHDLRERQEAERVLRTTADQLRQAQKMEAIGRLAGGVAHDFNNLLTGLLGFSELALMRLRPGDAMRNELEQIHAAAERGTALTKQLLAFSRKQVVEARDVDVNTLLEGLEPLLRRLLDARIRIERSLAPQLGHVRVDPNQLEQVIMNLAVNARDAMPSGGVLSLETSDVTLGPAELIADDGTELLPGSYVRIKVVDTGVGMDPSTPARIFEPFFTTKDRGKGTGLGLSTVYGIIKQCGGAVLVETQLGKGSSFELLLPAASGETKPAPASRVERLSVVHGSETVLLAEDDPAVRELSRRVLSSHGYRVLAADSGESALRLVHKTRERIDLLLTDVMMPGCSGPELARELLRTHPGLPVLFMSGYTDTAVAGCSMGDLAPQILQKPFVPRALLQRVREALSGSRRADPSSPRQTQWGPQGQA
ncbi:MAG: response regulator [Myxococcales bacterium]